MKSSPAAPRVAWCAALLALTLLGCGEKHEARTPQDAHATENPGRHEAANEHEKQVLASLDTLKPGEVKTVGKDSATADESYASASGQRCRHVTFSAGTKLACRDDQGWYFVPDVFGVATEAP